MCKSLSSKDLYLEKLRHSAAHLLAQAISEIFPETIFTIGPATETGFFYDVLPKEKNFKLEDLDLKLVAGKNNEKTNSSTDG